MAKGWGGGGGGEGRFYGRDGTLTMNACEARGGYEKRWGGGGEVLSASGPIRKAGGGGGGGGLSRDGFEIGSMGCD